MMPTIKGQVLVSTALDGQNERSDKAFLERLLATLPPQMPLNQEHDLSKPVGGHIENFRLHGLGGAEWAIVGDVTFLGEVPRDGNGTDT